MEDQRGSAVSLSMEGTSVPLQEYCPAQLTGGGRRGEEGVGEEGGGDYILERLLIPLGGDQDNMVDRYDCRLLVEGDVYGGWTYQGEGKKKEEEEEEEEEDVYVSGDISVTKKRLDRERYRDLPTEDSSSSSSSEEEKEGEGEGEQKVKRPKLALSASSSTGAVSVSGSASRGSYNALPFSYDNEEDQKPKEKEKDKKEPCSAKKKEEPFLLSPYLVDLFITSCHPQSTQKREWPQHRNQFEVICRTGRLVFEKGRQMEIILKTKQRDNPLFGFLNGGDVLHWMYERVMDILEKGTASVDELLDGKKKKKRDEEKGEQEEDQKTLRAAPLVNYSSSDDGASDGVEKETGRGTGEQSAKREPVGEQVREAMDKLARYVAKNGDGFEEIVRKREGHRETFSFLNPSHSLYRTFRGLVGKYSRKDG
eukprot:Nk52_evm1s2444 gene=Nk52_evmTU1s2444